MSSKVRSDKFMQARGRFLPSSYFPVLLVATIMALPLGVVLGILNPLYGAEIAGALIIAFIIALRQDQLAAVLIIAVHLYVDWYLGLRFAALEIALALLLIFFLARSPQHPWVGPRAFWLWMLLLVLAIFPTIQGIIWSDSFTYYLTIIFGALITFWLGAVIAQNGTGVRRFFKILAGLGTLLAIHSLIQAATGTLLLGSARYDQYLAQVSNFELSASTTLRAGSFFVNPDWSGTFFAMMLFVPVGLFFESTSLTEKVLYFIETFLMALALLSTYSTGAWVASIAGVIIFVALVGSMHYRVQLLLFIITISLAIFVAFPTQVGLQLHHAADSSSLSVRIGAWQTAIQVIDAFPLTGFGLGLLTYLARAESYRVLAQYRPLAHPHNAYLELGAMAGLPVLTIFVALLLLALWWAIRNWAAAGVRTRSLLGGGIAAVITLSVNSMSINGWTLAPLAATGWLMLGVLSSPLIAETRDRSSMQEKGNRVKRASFLPIP